MILIFSNNVNIDLQPLQNMVMQVWVWLNGRLHVPLHRVVMRENKTRFSLALFEIPKPGNSLKAIEKMVDNDHPLLFNPFDYEEFIKFHFSGDPSTEKYAVKAYCGVSN
ncbi:putative isopenicillin N synthase [Helianthus annuus]|nr:putative isopenicillin N synthase [Helianthus annuus]